MYGILVSVANITSTAAFRERLVPGPGIFIALLLFIPAVSLVTLPINATAAIPAGITTYILFAVVLWSISPTLAVEGTTFTAGQARIDARYIGEIELLGSEGMRRAIGPGTDARSFLLIRGWIHRGVRIRIEDPADPTPYWVLTTRHPQALADALAAAKAAEGAE